jgi:hypothetical protein
MQGTPADTDGGPSRYPRYWYWYDLFFKVLARVREAEVDRTSEGLAWTLPSTSRNRVVKVV